MELINDKEFLGWYLITLMLKKTVETNLPAARALIPPVPSHAQTSVDGSWIVYIHEELNKAGQYKASTRLVTTIFRRVPQPHRDVDVTAYTPKIVSIGPYHLDDSNLREMDRHKWRALHNALCRTGHYVGLYLDAVRSLENRVRSCYETLSISSNRLVLSLVLDSIFVLELFNGYFSGFHNLGYAYNDPVFNANEGLLNRLLLHDMLMFENQLPLFLLDHILALQRGGKSACSDGVTNLSNAFFKRTRNSFTLTFNPLLTDSKTLHCLDLFYRSVFFSSPKTDLLKNLIVGLSRKLLFIDDSYCASELQFAGIKFVRTPPGEAAQFWKIQLNYGVLKIPLLHIDGHTKSYFSNLIAFELCHLKCDKKTISYIDFMNKLIKSEVDVKCLTDQGIISHTFKNDGEVVNLFSQLCLKLTVDITDSYLLELITNVNAYYEKWRAWRRWYSNFKKKCNNWKASLIKEYFGNPWSFISLIAATILLLLTFAQTFYAIYDHYKPN